MSNVASLSIEHHVYGSAATGFATLHGPGSFDRAALLGIERRCGYALPPGSEAPTAATLPIKRTCFMVGGRLAVGRAVYLGVDVTQRRGNYLCHHLVLDPAEVAEEFEDPITLIGTLEAAGAFLDSALSDWSELPSSIDLRVDSAPLKSQLSEGLARAMLTVCFGWDKTRAPALVVGDDDALLGLLSASLRALPRTRRWTLPIDSYVFGADWRELAFVGLPDGREYARGVTAWSLRVDAACGTWEWRKQIPEAPIVGYLSSSAAVSAKQRAAVATSVDHIERQDWRALARELESLDDHAIQAVYAAYREPLLRHLAGSGDAVIAAGFAVVMAPVDVEYLARFETFEVLLAMPCICSRVGQAALGSGPASPLLAWIARDRALLDQFLQALGGALITPAGLAVAASLVRLVPPDDADSLYRIFGHIESNCRLKRPDPAMTASLIGEIRGLPLTDAALSGMSLYTLHCLGDGNALDRLLASPEIAAATFTQWPSLLGHVLRIRLRDDPRLRGPLELLVQVVEDGSLTTQTFAGACDDILRDERVDVRERRRFAKDLAAALSGASDTPWAGDMLDACGELVNGGRGSTFFSRKDKS